MIRRAQLLALAALVAAGALAAGVLASGSTTASRDGPATGATGRQGPSHSKGDDKEPAARRNGPQRRRELPIAPKLIGLPAESAREVLADRSIPVKMVGGYDNCRDVPPGGRVVDQLPYPGGRVYEKVYLSVDVAAICSRDAAITTCQPEDLSLRAAGYEGWHAGSGGTKVANLRVRNEGEYACQLDSTGQITLLDSTTGQNEPVSGNPTTLVVDWRLRPKEDLDVEWNWRNWCGEEGEAFVTVELGGLSDTDEFKTPLLCDYPKRASTLTGPDVIG